MAKILILTGDAVEALEVFYPYYRFLEAGMEADIASPSVKSLYTVNHDFIEGYETFVEKLRMNSKVILHLRTFGPKSMMD